MSKQTITPDNMPLVTKKDVAPAGKPDECFWCNQKIGHRHLWKCAAVTRKVLLKVTLKLEEDVPVSWDAKKINWRYNKSSWCGSNLERIVSDNIEKLGRNGRCGCKLLIDDVEYIEDGEICEVEE